jgi:hypothetical protein
VGCVEGFGLRPWREAVAAGDEVGAGRPERLGWSRAPEAGRADEEGAWEGWAGRGRGRGVEKVCIYGEEVEEPRRKGEREQRAGREREQRAGGCSGVGNVRPDGLLCLEQLVDHVGLVHAVAGGNPVRRQQGEDFHNGHVVQLGPCVAHFSLGLVDLDGR